MHIYFNHFATFTETLSLFKFLLKTDGKPFRLLLKTELQCI